MTSKDFTESDHSQVRQQIQALQKTRNLLLLLCAVLAVTCLTLASRLNGASLSNAPPTAEPSETADIARSVPNAFVASINSDKFHTSSCDFASNINPENRVYYATTTEAKADGRKPCSRCCP